MWAILLENAALILGLVISIYTIYSAADSYFLRRRQRLAIIRSLRIKLRYLFILAGSFAALVSNAKDKHVVEFQSQQELLPDEAADDVERVLLRASHLLSFDIDWDAEKIASALSKDQIENFLAFIEKYQTYKEVLTVRTSQLEKFPTMAGPLLRLSAVASVNLEDMKNTHEAFEASFDEA